MLAFILVVLISLFGTREAFNLKYDVIIYSATPAGFAAALAAKASGANTVLLLEPTKYVGGMASPGGIGLRDCEIDEIRINNSTQYEWAMRNARFYGSKDPLWQPDHWLGELHFIKMLLENGVELRLKTNFVEGSAGVRTVVDKSGLRRITAIQLETGEWIECKYFIDASYEGEVMMATGRVTYTFGRESRSVYNESLAGITADSLSQFKVPINPYVSENNKTLLKYIQDRPDPRFRVGEGDDNLIAYSFRACLTNNPVNRVPFKEPPGYDPVDFELSRRVLLADLKQGISPRLPWISYPYNGYPSSIIKTSKVDACCGSSSVGIDAVGLAVGYANASRVKRKEIYDEHKYYVQGLMWFWMTDPSVPEDTRDYIKSVGLCRDEWPDNGHFPPQLYVREAARIVGDKVYTQNSRVSAKEENGCLEDSIAVGSWGYDIHDMQRVKVNDILTGQPMVYNEGLTSGGEAGMFPFEVPYYIMLPKRKEMVNLAVPNCISASHVAFSGIRVEPTLWQIGQAAGTAAGLALQQGGDIPLHDVNMKDLQKSLIEQGAFVHWPPRDSC